MKQKIFFNGLMKIMIVMLFFIGCGSSGSDYTGKWTQENASKIIEISQQGENYIIQEKSGGNGGPSAPLAGIYSLSKENNLSGQNDMVTIMYNKNSKKLLISAWGGQMENWIRVK